MKNIREGTVSDWNSTCPEGKNVKERALRDSEKWDNPRHWGLNLITYYKLLIIEGLVIMDTKQLLSGMILEGLESQRPWSKLEHHIRTVWFKSHQVFCHLLSQVSTSSEDGI